MNFTPMPRDYEPEAPQADIVLVAADHQLDEVTRIVEQLARANVKAVVKTRAELDEATRDYPSILDLTDIPMPALERFDLDVKTTRKMIRQQRMKQLQLASFKSKKR